MTTGVFLAVILAALLHAGWNALIKLGTSKLTGMLILSLSQGAMGLAIATTRPLPPPESWLWLLGSGLFHTAYQLLLAFAYDRGDLSRVYPIARGAAPLMVTIVGAVMLKDLVTGPEYAGILTLGAGIILMAHGVFRSGESRRLVPLAMGSALATAGYSLVDGLGARVSGDAATYVAWLFLFSAAMFLPVCILLRGPAILVADRRAWGLGVFAAFGSYGAYAIAVWAMTVAPIALVAALRETSILFAVLIGWLVFGDRMDRDKALASILIVAGVVLTRL